MLKRNQELDFDKEALKRIAVDLAAMNSHDEPWFKEDKLDRGPHIRAITDLLLTTDGDFVMTLSSPWGTGKTTFMRMWKAYLEYKGYTCIMFNAWQHDYAENPFLTFIAEIASQLAELKGPQAEAVAGSLDKLKKIGKQLFPRLLSFAARAALGVSVDFEKLFEGVFDDEDEESRQKASDKLGEDFAKVVGSSLEGYAAEVLKEHGSTKQLVDDFKKELGNIVETLGKQPLFFFVDELDRCKPTYSVELLEAIKHLFETSGIIFVLSLDREQLGHSVKAAYGDGIDADGYLRRFIDLEYRIPEPEKKAFIKGLAEMYGLEEYPIFKNHQYPLPQYLDEFIAVAETHRLRTIEKAFLRGSVLLCGLKPVHSTYFMTRCLAPLVLLRELSPDAFDDLLNNIEWSEILEKHFPNKKPQGFNSFMLEVWPKHAHTMKYNRDNFRLDQIAGDSRLTEDARFASYYLETYNTHLIDDIAKLLDLSENLVPTSQAKED